MAKPKSTFGLHAAKLAHLFGLAADQNTGESELDHAPDETKLLIERLGEHLPDDLWSSGELPEQWKRFGRTMDSVIGLSLKELLIGLDTDPALLRQVKDYAARLSSSTRSKGHKQVANVIYYAAIAKALLHHGHKLTEFSYRELYEAYTRLADVQWVTPELVQLFVAAARVCAAGEDTNNKEAPPDE